MMTCTRKKIDHNDVKRMLVKKVSEFCLKNNKVKLSNN
jgi:hypothetical protein